MRDPVCGMTVGPDAATVEGYPEFGFCSEHCRREFSAGPERYLDQITLPGTAKSARTTGIESRPPPKSIRFIFRCRG